MLLSSVSQMWKHRLGESKSLREVSELLSDRVRTETRRSVCRAHSPPLCPAVAQSEESPFAEKTCDLAGESSARIFKRRISTWERPSPTIFVQGHLPPPPRQVSGFTFFRALLSSEATSMLIFTRCPSPPAKTPRKVFRSHCRWKFHCLAMSPPIRTPTAPGESLSEALFFPI